MSCKSRVGDTVFIFSESLDEILVGIVEGFNEERTLVKVLQETSDGLIRHLVSWINVFEDLESASEAQDLQRNLLRSHNTLYQVGMTVHLIQSGALVTDKEGHPLVYQIIRVYTKSRRVSLVNSYGETIGTFSFAEIKYCSSTPLFRESDYHVGQSVSWIEGDAVYEGVVIQLSESKAELANIKKLFPVDEKKWLPYYKLQSEDLYDKKNSMILASIVGDTLDSD